MLHVEDSLTNCININRFSSYARLIRVTARVIAMYRRNPKLSFKNATEVPDQSMLEAAELLWIYEAQYSIRLQVEQGQFKRLCPQTREDGVVVISGRVEKWMEISYDHQDVILLPYSHRLSKLHAEHVYNKDHLGIASTASKIKLRFWITNLYRLVKSVKNRCIQCRKNSKLLQSQMMGQLPQERLKPAPAWSFTSLDFFGPFEIRGETNKRSRGKAYGVLFTCMLCRAVHLDLATDYSTNGFLIVLRRFMSLRGYPSKLRSDTGSQLVAANKELKAVIKVQMKCFFLFPNLKEQQKSGRSPFTVS